MADVLALAHTTAILKSLLVTGLSRTGIATFLHDSPAVTTLPPDRILVGENEPTQINLFLYQVTPGSVIGSGSRLLQDANANPEETREEERPVVPLQLDLYYLLTAYGNRGFEIEVLLGAAVRVLHERRVLRGRQIQQELGRLEAGEDNRLFEALSAPDRPEQVEQLTITPQFLNTEELSRLWSALQARFRPSVAYKVTSVIAAASGKGVAPTAVRP